MHKAGNTGFQGCSKYFIGLFDLWELAQPYTDHNYLAVTTFFTTVVESLDWF